MLQRFLSLAAAVLLWWLLSALLHSLILPSPWVVLDRLHVLLLRDRLLLDTGLTLLRVVAGTGLGFLPGVAVGILLAHSRSAHRLLDPVLQLLRPVSPFAWTPLVILVFGLGHLPVLVTIAAGVFFPALVAVDAAIRGIAREYRDTAAIFGVAGWALLSAVELPLIRDELRALLRVMAGVGWILAVGAEMLAAGSGLGFRLMDARYLLDFPALYAGMVVTGVVGFALDLLLRRVTEAV